MSQEDIPQSAADPSDQLFTAMLTLHKFSPLYMDQTEALDARNIILSVSTDVLTTPFLIHRNKRYQDEMDSAKKLKRVFRRLKGLERRKILPIHLAAFLGNNEVVNLFIQKFPAGSSTVDNYGLLPIKYAIRGGCVETVRLLIKLYPEALSRLPTFTPTTNDGTTCIRTLPIHCAAAEGNVEIIELILKAYPEGIASKNTNNDLPLHYATRKGRKSAVMHLIVKYPDGSKSKGSDGSLPLHLAARGDDLELAKLVYSFYPEAAGIRSDNGAYLPIDDSARSRKSLEILKWLVETTNPSEIARFESFLRAIYHGNIEGIKYLLEQYPRLAFRKRIRAIVRGDSVMHHAVNNGHFEIAQFLGHKYPSLFSDAGHLKGLPLHTAASKNRFKIANFLLVEHPKGAHAEDSNGCTPMHLASKSGSVAIAGMMLDTSPLVLMIRNNDGKLPVQLAIENGHKDTAILNIERALSSSILREKFTHHIFTSHEQEEEEEELQSFLWQRRNSIFSTLIDKFGSEVLLEVQTFKTYPVILQAIGKIPVSEIEFMIDLLQIELADLTDSQGQCTLTVLIKEASKKEEHWEPYFKPLLEMMNPKLHQTDVTNDRSLFARGNGIKHNILHNAVLNSLPWYGLEDVCEANNDNFIIPHDESGLYPFMLPPISAISDNTKMVDLTYKMLRMRPDVIKVTSDNNDEGHCRDEDGDIVEVEERSTKRPRLKK